MCAEYHLLNKQRPFSPFIFLHKIREMFIMKKMWRRLFGVVLAAAVSVTMPGMPSYVWAEEAVQGEKGEAAGICEHHPEHTEDCGYSKGQPCMHEHDEDCYEMVKNCVHVHGPECYLEVEDSEGEVSDDGEDSGSGDSSGQESRKIENCSHVCTEEGGCITRVLNCQHVHDEACGYAEAGECTYVCEICSGNEMEDNEGEEEDTENMEENPEEGLGEEGENSAFMASESMKKLAARSSGQTENSVARVTIDGVEEYYDNFTDAWNAAQGKTAQILLLKDVETSGYRGVEVNDGASDITLEMNDGVTLSGNIWDGVINVNAGKVTLNSGTISSEFNNGIQIKGGEFILNDGIVSAPAGKTNRGVCVENGGTFTMNGGQVTAGQYGVYCQNSAVTISGGKISITSVDGPLCLVIFGNGGNTIDISGDVELTATGRGGCMSINSSVVKISNGTFSSENGGALSVTDCDVEISGGVFECGADSIGLDKQGEKGSVRLSGGVFSSGYCSVRTTMDKFSDWLEEGYSFVDMEGNIVESDTFIIWKKVEVSSCAHDWEDWTADRDGKHYRTCKGCGRTESGVHKCDENGFCSGCGLQAVAGVTVSGETDYHYFLDTAWEAAQGKTATVKILQNFDLGSDTLEVNDAGSNITLEMAEGVVLERSQVREGCIIHAAAGNFVLAGGTLNFSAWGSGTHDYNAKVILIEGGNVRLEGGTVTMKGPIGVNASCACGIIVNSGSLTIDGGEIDIPGYNSAGVRLTGGEAVMETGSITANGPGIDAGGGKVTVNGGSITTLYNFGGGCVNVSGGEVTINAGTFDATHKGTYEIQNVRESIRITKGSAVINDGTFIANEYGVSLPNGSTGSLEIHGGTFTGESGCGLNRSGGSGSEITLYGGTYTGNKAIVSPALKEILAEGYVYYTLENGEKTPITLTSSYTLSGTVTVDKCEHSYGDWEPDNQGSHIRTCANCGIKEKEACNYEYRDVSDAGTSGSGGTHMGVCRVCGHETAKEPHTFTAWGDSGSENGYVRTCRACGRQHRAVITQSPAQIQTVYGAAKEQELSVTVTGADASYVWKLQGKDAVLSEEKSFSLPADLSAGDYIYQCAITLEDDSAPAVMFSYSLRVTPADLGKAVITVEEGDGIFYNKEAREPDVSAALNGKTLVKDTDYTVAYTDNTNVGTGTVTVTGIGNYTGLASQTFAIRFFKTDVVATAPNGWCNGAKISAPSGYTLAPSLDGTFGESFFYERETGAEGADVTYYLKQDGTNYISDAKTIKVKVDTTPPVVDGTGTGIKITDRDAWWQKLLTVLSFGHYKTQEVTVLAQDDLSGIDRIYYYIDRAPGEKPLTAEELKELSADKWTASDSVTFQLDEEDSYVIYAYAMDKAGNQSAYICSDGIVIDNTPPTVTLAGPSQAGMGDTSAVFAAQMNETGNITYVISDTENSSIAEQDILNSAGGVKRSVTAEQVQKDIELSVTGLKANTTYYVYAVGTDAAGNIGRKEETSFTTLKTAIAGSVSIAGKKVYGEKLTASVNVGTPNHGRISYQWYRIEKSGNETAIIGAVWADYMLTAEDIGCSIRVEVTAENCSGALTTTAAGPVGKADCPAENIPVKGRVNDAQGTDTFTFTGKSGTVYEYSTDGGRTWREMEASAFAEDASDSTKVIGTLSVGNYAYAAGQVQVRAKETEVYEAGEALKSSAAFTANLEGSVSLEGITKYGETLTASAQGIQSGVSLVYSFYRNGETVPVQTGSKNTYTLTQADIGKDISVRVTAKGYAGVLTADGAGTVQKADGKRLPGSVDGSYIISGETYTYTVNAIAGAEYRMDDGSWQDSNVFSDVVPGSSHTFYARMKETDCYQAGEAGGTALTAFLKITPPAPALCYQVEKAENGVITVIIAEVPGAEYSFDGITYLSGEGANKKEYAAEETIKLAIRLKGTQTHNPSPIMETEVNLAKGSQDAPEDFQLIYAANGEKDYTVTIPATEGCEYSFDGVNWSENNTVTGTVGEVIAGYKRYKETSDSNAGNMASDSVVLPRFQVKMPVVSPAGGKFDNGSTVTVTITCETAGAEIYYTTDGSTPSITSLHYTGAFSVTVPTVVRAIALKAGMRDSNVASADYIKKSGQPSQGGETDKPGDGSSFRPGGSDTGGAGDGLGSGSDSGNAGISSMTGEEKGSILVDKAASAKKTNGNLPENEIAGERRFDRLPFIKPAEGTESSDSKKGWEIIKKESENAMEGDTINVDMNGTTIVPGNVLDALKNRNIAMTFDMGNGMIWRVNGKSIAVDKVSDIDFSVKVESMEFLPDTLAEAVEEADGKYGSYRLYLSHQGEFGFTAVLSFHLEKENAGLYANLVDFQKEGGGMRLIESTQIAEEGAVELAFTGGEDYVIIVSEASMTTSEEEAKEDSDAFDEGGPAEDGKEEERNIFLSVLAPLAALCAGSVGIWLLRRKKKGKNS